MLCMLAITGDEEKAGYKTVCGTARVEEGTGKNYFTECENGLHKFVVKAKENDYYKTIINERVK